MIIYWNTKSGTILTSIIGPVADEAEKRDAHTGTANKVVCKQWIPTVAVGWKTNYESDWQPMASCPINDNGKILKG